MIIAGILVCIGWATGNASATRLFFEGEAISVVVAIEFILAGTVFVVAGLRHPLALRLMQRGVAAGLLALSTVGAIGLLTDGLARSLYFSTATLAMSPGAVAVFVLSGVLLLMLAPTQSRTNRLVIQLGTAGIAAIGVILILNEYVNTDYIFTTGKVKQAALGTAILFLALAVGMWGLWRDAAWNNHPRKDVKPSSIYLAVDVLVTVIVATVALIAFGLSQGRSQEIMLDQMDVVAKDKRLFFDTLLNSHFDKALLSSERPAIIKALVEIAEDRTSNGERVELMTAAAHSFVKRDFSAFSIRTNDGKLVASAGSVVVKAEQRIRLWGNTGVELLWDKGYVLRTHLPVHRNDEVVGFVDAEQRMDDLTLLHKKAISGAQTSDMVVCAADGDKQQCFPFRWSKVAAQFPSYLDGRALPLTRASNGETATEITTDFRRERVMAAFGPIGSTGLGMAIKRDMTDLYAPIRKQFFSTFPFFLCLILVSIGVARAMLNPLINALELTGEKMRVVALTDALTGLANRALFDDRLQLSMGRSRRTKSTMALMFVDLDKFKSVNDRFGHNTGDELLQWCAAQMALVTRETDTVARLGGDEFTLILDAIPNDDVAKRIAGDLVDAIGRYKTVFPALDVEGFGASIGIAFYRGDSRTPKQLVACADAALYECKKSGRASFNIAEYEESKAL
ncbi:GGDEF domain-containing protein [Actimicrobium antarcticum]|uniref:GGDEF domain-containing protein n=1 Tax=Actimicrobium antarcticum TaxID=1051899 RepID=UPI0031E4118B